MQCRKAGVVLRAKPSFGLDQEFGSDLRGFNLAFYCKGSILTMRLLVSVKSKRMWVGAKSLKPWGS